GDQERASDPSSRGLRRRREREQNYRIAVSHDCFTRHPRVVGYDRGVATASLLRGMAALVIRYDVITREEAYLKRKFGDVYRPYHTRVRRWLQCLSAHAQRSRCSMSSRAS